ncbi:hypothetical protein MRX96_007388 [Rhipicephalus microplus]
MYSRRAPRREEKACPRSRREATRAREQPARSAAAPTSCAVAPARACGDPRRRSVASSLQGGEAGRVLGGGLLPAPRARPPPPRDPPLLTAPRRRRCFARAGAVAPGSPSAASSFPWALPKRLPSAAAPTAPRPTPMPL